MTERERRCGQMIECVMAWICLFIGAVTRNPDYLIASGTFAIAAQIEFRHKKGGEG